MNSCSDPTVSMERFARYLDKNDRFNSELCAPFIWPVLPADSAPTFPADGAGPTRLDPAACSYSERPTELGAGCRANGAAVARSARTGHRGDIVRAGVHAADRVVAVIGDVQVVVAVECQPCRRRQCRAAGRAAVGKTAGVAPPPTGACATEKNFILGEPMKRLYYAKGCASVEVPDDAQPGNARSDRALRKRKEFRFGGQW
jgi:hypothetical protein